MTFESIKFGVYKNMDQLHILNDNNVVNFDNNTLYLMFLVIIILLFKNILNKDIFIQPRNWWIYARSSHQWKIMYNDVFQMIPAICDIEWYKDFQMGYNIYILLYNILKPYIVRADANYKKAVRIDKVVAMILYKLAFGYSERIIGQKFAQRRSIVKNKIGLILNNKILYMKIFTRDCE
jgi:hypothetical protein